MKKTLSIFLIVAVVLSLGTTTAFATEVNEDSDVKTGNTSLTYEVTPTYTVTIPATVALGNTATVSAENVILDEGEALNVRITGTSEEDNSFKVHNGSNAKLSYTITDGSKSYNINDTVLTVNPDIAISGSNTLTFTEPTDAKYSGTYTGSVTFTVSVEPQIGYTGSGTSDDPYVVYNREGLLAVMDLTDNETNYIQLAKDVDVSDDYVTQGSSNIILDLKGYTLSAKSVSLRTGTVTVKNGIAPPITASSAVSVTLSGLKITHSGGGSAVSISGTAVIDDCTFISNLNVNVYTYALRLGGMNSNVTATNVTLMAGTAAYDTNSSATFILDGQNITEDCPTAEYRTAGRTE